MLFKGDRAIYLQIVDHVLENIMSANWSEGDRIPSVRDMAMAIEVNPNTVAHAYGHLQERGIIHNQRGVGYFVSPQAREKVREMEKETFFVEQLPAIFKRMLLLDIDMDELTRRFEQYARDAKEEDDENKQ